MVFPIPTLLEDCAAALLVEALETEDALEIELDNFEELARLLALEILEELDETAELIELETTDELEILDELEEITELDADDKLDDFDELDVAGTVVK